MIAGALAVAGVWVGASIAVAVLHGWMRARQLLRYAIGCWSCGADRPPDNDDCPSCGAGAVF